MIRTIVIIINTRIVIDSTRLVLKFIIISCSFELDLFTENLASINDIALFFNSSNREVDLLMFWNASSLVLGVINLPKVGKSA